MRSSVLILGGGAAGLTAGCLLARNGFAVSLLEKAPRTGRKLAATGNGRCNLTNIHASPADYGPAAAFVTPALTAWPPEKVLTLFRDFGIESAPDEEGRVYPLSNQASSVLDVLRCTFAEAGGREITEFPVASLVSSGSRWTAHTPDGRTASAPYVICAMGGDAAPNLGGCHDGTALLKQLGHSIRPCFPALTPLKCEHPRLRALKGIRASGTVTLMINGRDSLSETGEILFQEYGLSGIAVMQLSGDAAQAISRGIPCSIRIALTDMDADALRTMLMDRRDRMPGRAAENLLTGWINKRLGQVLLKLAGCDDLTAPSSSIPDDVLSALADLMTGWELPVTGTAGFGQAQVTRGGAARNGFIPDTLESRTAPGLYACGEVLDVDGPCGGYNLQWAFASALLCAEDIIRKG